MRGERIVASETRILTSATSSQFTMRSTLKGEGGLLSYEEANASLGYPVFAFRFPASEMSWVVVASAFIHSRGPAAAQWTTFLKGVSGRQRAFTTECMVL